MTKDKGGQSLPVSSSSGFVSFLKREFPVANNPVRKTDDSFAVPASVKKSVKPSVVKPKAINKKERQQVPDSLAFASKLSKSVEIFLEDENKGKKAFEIDFPSDWSKEYSKKQAELLRSADEVFSKKRAYRNALPANKAVSSVSFASVANDGVVKWTAVVLLILNISIYLGLFHGKSADLVIQSINRPIAKIIESVTSGNSNSPRGGVTDFAASEKAPKQEVSKEAMAEFIKNNSENITDEMAVSEEDLNGQVAGVSE